MPEADLPVLIVGGGPVGLSASLLLSPAPKAIRVMFWSPRCAASCRAINRASIGPPWPRPEGPLEGLSEDIHPLPMNPRHGRCLTGDRPIFIVKVRIRL